MRPHHTHLTPLLAILFTCAAAAGCGGDDDGPDPAEPDAGAAAPDAEVVTLEPTDPIGLMSPAEIEAACWDAIEAGGGEGYIVQCNGFQQYTPLVSDCIELMETLEPDCAATYADLLSCSATIIDAPCDTAVADTRCAPLVACY